MASRGSLAMNVLLDSDAAHRNAELAALKRRLGACGVPEPFSSDPPCAPCQRAAEI